MANQRYQKTLRGKQKHAKRQQRYRQRQKEKVTDHTSPDLPSHDVLPRKPNEHKVQQEKKMYCDFCGEVVSPFLRNGYLRYHIHEKSPRSSPWPLGP
jgi:hypothetical protein